MPAKSRTLTRDDWIALARKILIQYDINEVKINRLARRLKVTRGSFYHHFTDHKDLVDALLKDWEVRNLAEIREIQDRWSRVDPDLTEVIALWLGEDSGFLAFDMAVRSWARKARRVDDAVHRVDAAWIELLQGLFRIGGYGEDEGLVRARIIYFHQIGYYALAVRETVEERLKLVPVYYQALTGKPPGAELGAVLDGARAKLRKIRARPAT